jgi:hypothetical protein
MSVDESTVRGHRLVFVGDISARRMPVLACSETAGVRSAIRDELRSRLRLAHGVCEGPQRVAAGGLRPAAGIGGQPQSVALCVVAATLKAASLLINGARC